ncbi:MAG: hypothetical protein JRJ49_00135 [Deltaproteobacteria bacterium]|nr:hypothetical protein [Deltaproteobacteria bacterium]
MKYRILLLGCILYYLIVPAAVYGTEDNNTVPVPESTHTNYIDCDNSNSDQIWERLRAARRQYELTTHELESAMSALSLSFRECTSQRWRVLWNPCIIEAEKARRQLEAQRRRIMRLRRDVESDPGPGNAKLYCRRMQGEIFHGYDIYIEGINGYFSFIESSTTMCNQKNFANCLSLKTILDAIGVLSSIRK